jgi:hypothetical protein
MLVQWDLVGAMVITEDVAAVSAVVAAGEVAKRLATGGMVADGGFVVRLLGSCG